MDFKTTKTRWLVDSDGAWISFLHPDRKSVQEFITQTEISEEKPYAVEVKPWKKKKSNEANAYCWTLLGELSRVLGRSDEDIYRELIPNIGGNNYIVPVKDDLLEHWAYQWEHVPKTKIGWTTKVLGKCKNIEGYSNTINYYGSSMYDSAQMARLIDLVIQECKEQGIETASPNEIARLKAEWNGGRER